MQHCPLSPSTTIPPAVVLATMLAFATQVPAQGLWDELDLPSGRGHHATAHDPVHQRTILFGGFTPDSHLGDTWAWDGSDWSRLHPARSPSPRRGHAMAYHAASGKIVLFGGYSGSSYLGDTWLWDGTDWTQVFPRESPGARFFHNMAYDAARGRLVLFGGVTSSYFGDTWEFDGNNWLAVTPTPSPPARYGHSMAYDPVRDRIVLFGGYRASGSHLNDLWEWNAATRTWTQISPAVSPAARYFAGATYDPNLGGMVILGGSGTTPAMNDCWLWDGATWTSIATPIDLVGRDSAGMMSHDSTRSRTVLFGGGLGGAGAWHFLTDTWELDASGWQRRESGSPPPRGQHSMAFDPSRGRVVLFGGLVGENTTTELFDDTWEWDGTRWIEMSPATVPPARRLSALGWDPVSQRVLMFGGYDGTVLQDTWAWDGTDWTQLAPPTAPSGRLAHSLAVDPVNDRLLMFGGTATSGGSAPLNETWQWTGINWVQLNPTASPSPRYHVGLATDSRRQRIVLYGGYSGGGLGQTWEWDGANWNQINPAHTPGIRYGMGMAFDARQRLVILQGGYSNRYHEDTWEWDGSDWIKRTQGVGPSTRYLSPLVYDGAREKLVLFGNWPSLGDTWLYYNRNQAELLTFGSGCPTTGGQVPTLEPVADGLPWIGETFGMTIQGQPTGPTLTFLVFGGSKTSWPPFALPLDLGVVGFSGCFLNVAFDASSAGTTHSIPIPPQYVLAGLSLFMQGGTFEILGNRLGMTPGIEARIGHR